MKTSPMIFNSEMVRALLSGQKTQTRRIIKPQPDCEGLAFNLALKEWHDTSARVYRCPAGKPGDLIYIRETCAEWDDGIAYRESSPQCDGVTKWTPSIHMKRKHSRLTLKITDVRIERVQELTWQDALKEGYEGDMPMIDSVNWFIKLWSSIYNNWNDNPWVWVYEFEVIKQNVDDYLMAGNQLTPNG